MSNAPVLYDDKDVKVREDQVTIKCYFFPFGNSKKIPISQIKEVKMVPFAWKGKLWGMNVTQWGYWMPGDLDRWDYDRFIALDTGSSITPSFTCKNLVQVYELIAGLVQKHKQGEQRQRQDNNSNELKQSQSDPLKHD